MPRAGHIRLTRHVSPEGSGRLRLVVPARVGDAGRLRLPDTIKGRVGKTGNRQTLDGARESRREQRLRPSEPYGKGAGPLAPRLDLGRFRQS